MPTTPEMIVAARLQTMILRNCIRFCILASCSALNAPKNTVKAYTCSGFVISCA